MVHGSNECAKRNQRFDEIMLRIQAGTVESVAVILEATRRA